MFIPQTAVRMGFLLFARELVRSGPARPVVCPGARFVLERKNTVNVKVLVGPPAQRHKNAIQNHCLFYPRAKKHSKTNSFVIQCSKNKVK